MKTLAFVLTALLPLYSSTATSATVVIHDAKVHTATSAGVLEHTDIVITDGKITEMGHSLKVPAGAEVIEANGKPVTPGLFGGISHLGLEEIGLEPSAEDFSLKLGSMRPEFDVTPAFNPESIILAVNMMGGITFAVVAPSAEPGGKNGGGT